MSPLRTELEASHHERSFGSGWISGVLALTLALVDLGAPPMDCQRTLDGFPADRDPHPTRVA